MLIIYGKVSELLSKDNEINTLDYIAIMTTSLIIVWLLTLI